MERVMRQVMNRQTIRLCIVSVLSLWGISGCQFEDLDAAYDEEHETRLTQEIDNLNSHNSDQQLQNQKNLEQQSAPKKLYQWQDEQGKLHLSDSPPAGVQATVIDTTDLEASTKSNNFKSVETSSVRFYKVKKNRRYRRTSKKKRNCQYLDRKIQSLEKSLSKRTNRSRSFDSKRKNLRSLRSRYTSEC